MDCWALGALESKIRRVILWVTCVSRPVREAAGDEKIQGRLHGGDSGFFLQVAAGAERCWY